MPRAVQYLLHSRLAPTFITYFGNKPNYQVTFNSLILPLAAHVSIAVVAGSTTTLALVAILIGIAVFIVFKRRTAFIDPGAMM